MTTFGATAPLRYRLATTWRNALRLPPAPAVRGVASEPGLRGETTRDLRPHHVYVSGAIVREPGETTVAIGWSSADWLRSRHTVPLDPDPQAGHGDDEQAADPPFFREVAARLGQSTDDAEEADDHA